MKTLIATLATVILSTSAQAQSKYEPGTYNIDPTHSRIGFEVAHLVFSTVEGNFKEFSGSFDLAKDFSKSKVEANVNVGSVDTDQEKRDAHLKSDDFFSSDKFPKMTFKTQKIEGTPQKFKLIGDLTIKGTTKRVVFDGKLLGEAADGYGNQKVFFTAETKVGRKAFGLNWSSMVEAGPVVGDEVTIKLNIQGAKPKAQPKAS